MGMRPDRPSAWRTIVRKKILDMILAKDSLTRMKPLGDENFDTVDQDFPVEYVQAKPAVW